MLKIRCSQIGKIMPNSRTKGELSKTCKSYLEALAIENMYGYSKDIWSKAIDKGIAVEDQSIQLAQEVLDMGEMTKNEEFFENEYLTGTPDVLNEDFVLDVKSSLDAQIKEIDENPIVRATVERQHSFERVPAKYRVKTFKIEYDQEVVDKIYQRVEECREYYESLLHEEFKTVAV